ncbi:hypothetical protein BJAS_P3466 [Bathymodiolus japonicus methanotrophic gill symbiont]|uniref:hypothetical protein n=1 Tax=Bathymodiolus japonicus methanotrophic gill symbiont TaxID=113269 RepID=UPI001B75DEB6|nr:hypothetical protein [Bathymodiolus japonicus methanotrophic gill symbiont]GFO72929.1 hypothetical protein BJAS_P3466 [Bathymodiolus japonicus methanotrophic gill symbiont]
MKKVITALVASFIMSLSLSAFAEDDGYHYRYSCAESDPEFKEVKQIYIYNHNTLYMADANSFIADTENCSVVAFINDISQDNEWVFNDFMKEVFDEARTVDVPTYIELRLNE